MFQSKKNTECYSERFENTKTILHLSVALHSSNVKPLHVTWLERQVVQFDWLLSVTTEKKLDQNRPML